MTDATKVKVIGAYHQMAAAMTALQEAAAIVSSEVSREPGPNKDADYMASRLLQTVENGMRQFDIIFNLYAAARYAGFKEK